MSFDDEMNGLRGQNVEHKRAKAEAEIREIIKCYESDLKRLVTQREGILDKVCLSYKVTGVVTGNVLAYSPSNNLEAYGELVRHAAKVSSKIKVGWDQGERDGGIFCLVIRITYQF